MDAFIHGKSRKSAQQHPDVACLKLEREFFLGDIAGTFSKPPLLNLVDTHLGTIQKKEAGKFHMIHCSWFPGKDKIDNGIDKDLLSVSYMSLNAAL